MTWQIEQRGILGGWSTVTYTERPELVREAHTGKLRIANLSGWRPEVRGEPVEVLDSDAGETMAINGDVG